MQMCHSLRCKLLAENMQSLGTSFLWTSKRPFWLSRFAFVKVFKAVRVTNFIAVVMYWSQLRSPARPKNCYKSKSRSGIVFTQVY